MYTDFRDVGTDMHSHLIPGIDDGAVTVSDSVFLMSQLQEMGFSHLYTTPHSFPEIYPNTRESLQEGRDSLDNFIPEGIQLGLSSEYYLDEQFSQNLEDHMFLPLPGSRLLIEFSQVSFPLYLENQVEKIVNQGYTPIIAHPERYSFFQNRLDFLNHLKSMGAEIQLNALSLTPYYSRGTKALAESLVKANMFDFIGTDLHNAAQLEVLRKVPVLPYYAMLIESGRLKNQTLINKLT